MTERLYSHKRVPQKYDDEGAGMTDAQRLREFAETGNARYLTRGQIEATGIHIDEDGNLIERATDDREIEEEILIANGVDVRQLLNQRSEITQVIGKLLPLALITATERDFKKLDVKEVARKEISRFIFENPKKVVRTLMNECNPEKIESLELIRYLEEELKMSAEYYTMKRTHDPGARAHINEVEAILMAFRAEADLLRRRIYQYNDGRYLVFQSILDFCTRIELGSREDVDIYVPFEIQKGIYATFTEDKNRIYVADKEFSEEIAEALKEGWTSDYAKHGKDAASYKYEYLPESVIDAHDSIIDGGTPLIDILGADYKKNPELVKDYVSLLHSRFRAIIEEDLGFRLRDLSIQEQAHFLEFAKRVRWHQRDEIRAFISEWKIPGLRTFLAASVDPSKKVADEILVLSQVANEEAVRRVFNSFEKFTERVQSLNEFLRTTFNVDNIDAVNALTETILMRGRKYLGTAHTYRNDPDKLNALIKTVDVETEVLADACRLLYERGELNLENIQRGGMAVFSGSEKDNHLREIVQMEEILDKDTSGADAVLASGIKGKFKEMYGKETARFYAVDWENKVQTFMAFTDEWKPAHEVKGALRGAYFGFFRSNLKGGKLGEALLELALKKEVTRQEAQGRSAMIHAYCGPTISIAQKYFELGFVADTHFTKSGIERFHIVLDVERNKQLLTKQPEVKTRTDLEKVAQENPDRVRFVTGVVAQDLPLKMVNDDGGWLLTRAQYKPGDCYAVFEKSE